MTPEAVHPAYHLYWAGGLLVASIGIMTLVQNHIIRRRLLFSAVLAALALGVHFGALKIAAPLVVQFLEQLGTVELLLCALAGINLLVTVAFNRWGEDHARDLAPAIVQDSTVLLLFAIIATVVFRNHSEWLTGSAVAAAVVGFALQETLGNAFAGIAIQIERPFKVGHWITVASFEGEVTQITWRATKIKTKNGNLVIVPNNVMAREAINNYSEPAAPTRLFIEVGAAYGAPPNEVRAAIFAALRQVPELLEKPAPDIVLIDFAASAITYRVRFWITDYSKDEFTKDLVRRAIYYEFRRRNIEIPWPIQVEYARHEPPVDLQARRESFAKTIAKVPVLAKLSGEAHLALAAASEERLYADQEEVVREGDAGSSMFIVQQGKVGIILGLGTRGEKEVAITEAGGYFGEMSLLTGQPRTASVTAHGDTTVLEISADAFRTYVKENPEIIDQLAAAAAERQHALDSTRATTVVEQRAEQGTLAKLMRNFFGLH